MAVAEITLDNVILILYSQRLKFSVLAASLSLILYDYSLTLSHEIKYVWRTGQSLGRWLYVWTRYSGIVYLIYRATVQYAEVTNPKRCIPVTTIDAMGQVIIMWTAECIMAIRVWILFGRSRKLLYWLIAMNLTSFVLYTTLNIIRITRLDAQLIPVITSARVYFQCGLTGHNLFNPVILPIIPLVQSSVLFALTVHKTINTLQAQSYVKTPLIVLFVRDGIVYYFAVTAIFLLNAVGAGANISVLQYLSDQDMIVALCAVMARMMLNIRELMHNLDNEGSTIQQTRVHDLSTMTTAATPTVMFHSSEEEDSMVSYDTPGSPDDMPMRELYGSGDPSSADVGLKVHVRTSYYRYSNV